MKAKRLLSILLTMSLMLTLVLTLGMTNASAVTEISNNAPYITAIAGEALELSGYSLVFDGDATATADIVWKDQNGSEITSITPDSKGVTAITAEANGKTKAVYVVAKNADDSEYILFEANFSDYSSIQDLKDAGFSFNKQDSLYKLENGNLVIGSTSDDYARMILPQWLGDFGDYSITTEAKFLTTTNTSRWFGMVFRAQNENGQQYPYYHICTRENTTLANGVEFAERTEADVWNVAEKASATVASLKTDYHTFNVQAKGNDVQYNIDGKEIIYVTEAVMGIKTKAYKKGLVGITVNYGTLALKNIKVAVQENSPKRPNKTLVLLNNKHEDNNLRNAIANVQNIQGDIDSQLNSTSNVGVALFRASDVSDMTAVFKTCKKKGIIPTVHITSNGEADAVLSAITSASLRDVNVVSESVEVIGYIRGKSVFVRTGLIVDLQQSTLTSAEANEIRKSVRSAPATFCIIESTNATKEAVSELQELAVAVWVKVASTPSTDEFVIEAMKAVTSGANGIISENANEITKVINQNLAENAMTRTPIMIGHRGNPSQAPENSLSGFITAYENGADIFEVDVEITSDGEIIIMHDNTLNRTTNYKGTKKINQMKLSEVKEYYLLGKDGKVSEEKVPTLKEVLDEFKDKDCKIFVEFKGNNSANVGATAKIIQEYGMEDKVDVISFSGKFLEQTHQNLPGMSTGFLSSYKLTSPTYVDAVEGIMRALNDAQKYNSTINTGSGIFTLHFEQAATDRGVTVWPWTYVASSNNGAFLSCCDGLTTDDVQWCKDMAKYIQSDSYDTTINVSGTPDINISSVTYGNAVNTISSESLIVSVLTGKDKVKIENGKLYGVQDGTATVVYGYPTKTTDGGEYVLYTQPITINVVGGEAQINAEKGLSTPVIIAIIAAVVIPLGILGGMLVSKKKKEK